MPASYQAPSRKDDTKSRTYSQSQASNLQSQTATVEQIVSSKSGGIYAITPEQTLREAVTVLRDKGIGALVVVDTSGALVGILSERDIVRKLADAPGQTLPQRVEDVMTATVETCVPRDSLVSVLKRMTEGRFRHMPVVDGSTPTGMITIGDVINYRLTELEHEALQLKQLIVG